MKKLLVLLVFTSLVVQAQYTIKGTMTPPGKGDWVMLQKLEGTQQKFLKHTTIKIEEVEVKGAKQKIGKFEFTLPKDAKPGMYRATYRNRGGGFVDFLFNNENIEMIFNPQDPDQYVFFTKSLENKTYNEYQDAFFLTQRTLDSIQIAYIDNKDKDSKKAYKKALKRLEDVQNIYETKTKGMLAHDFVKASKTDNPENIQEDIQDYLNMSVDNFFNNTDFTNKNLYNSSFLLNKIVDYVFYQNVAETQILQRKIYKETIPKVMDFIAKNKPFKKQIIEYFITYFTDKRDSEIVDWLFANYFDKLPVSDENKEFKKSKLESLRVSVGRKAPDFSWKEGGKQYKLSTLNDGENYLIIFWSTRCPHCVKEIPEIHEFMKQHPKTSVISFAIEKDEIDFNEFIKRLDGWHNVMGTHPEDRFKNKTVQDYLIDETPTYFVLNKDKKIISSPYSGKDVKDYFTNISNKK